MSYREFEQDLIALYRAEYMGEAMFSLLASLSFNARQKKCWQVLAMLERQTKCQYLDYLERQQLNDQLSSGRWWFSRTSARLTGLFFGLVFALLPWATAMRGLLSGTDDLIAVFERMHLHCGPDEKAYFMTVVAHEQAIAEFARAELDGASSSSLVPVMNLLQRR